MRVKKKTGAKPKTTASSIPRRAWYGPDKLRAAYLAGQGKSAGEIATIIGGTSGPRVRAMLRVHDIPLLREGGGEDILYVRWKQRDRETLNRIADRIDRDPSDLAALIVRKTLERKDGIERLVDPLDVVG